MPDHRDVGKTNTPPSGSSEEISETDQISDDLIQEEDTKEELRKNKNDGSTAQEARLVRAGEELSHAAVTRCRNKTVE